MKKLDFIKISISLILLSGLLLSCGKRTVMIDDELPKLTMAPKVTEALPFPDDYMEEDAADERPDMNDPNTDPHLRWGVWFAYNENESSYYFFENDNTTGVKVNVGNGVSTPFKYEQTDGSYMFHFDREDNNTPVTIEYPDFDHARITFPGGVLEELEYISSQTFAEFMFYTDEEFIRMAHNYFARTESDPKKVRLVNLQAHSLRNSDCIIQLYHSVMDPSTGKEKVTVVESYTVDRITGCGTDSKGGYVDLSR